MPKSSNYSHQRHTNRVIKSSKGRIAARMVLQCMCRRSEFDRPEVTITKNQISADTGLERKAIQRALRTLKAEGTIDAIANAEGGRGNATTYELIDIAPKETASTGPDPKAAIAKRRNELMAENKGMTFGTATDIAKRELKQ